MSQQESFSPLTFVSTSSPATAFSSPALSSVCVARFVAIFATILELTLLPSLPDFRADVVVAALQTIGFTPTVLLFLSRHCTA